MLTQPATREMVRVWKQVHAQYGSTLVPNRKTGAQVEAYLRSRYKVTPLFTEKARAVVCENVMGNLPFREKLAAGTQPDPVAYYAGENRVFVGIDLATGYFLCEGEGAAEIWDDLFAFRGLDQQDLDNPYLVWEYVRCVQNKKD